MTIIDSFELAAIDVGSNAARLLIKHADVDESGEVALRKSLFVRVPLRLGMDVFADGKLSEARSYQFLHTMKAYRQLMKVYGVTTYRACATSAMRDAKNGREMIKKIAKETGMKLEIISGDEESQIVYDNHLSLMSGPGNYLYVDVGGGSTEVTLMANGERLYSHSYNVGTIRLLEGKVPPETMMAMRQEIGELTKDYEDIVIIGSGGNINKLYRLADKRDKQVDRLPVATLDKWYKRLSKLSVEERMRAYGLKPDRADVIVPAAEIFLCVAACARAESIMVPSMGLADGIINDLVEAYKLRQKKTCNSTD
ncbi:MAG: Ppx/GppA family phosphatase [Prevotella sp.]